MLVNTVCICTECPLPPLSLSLSLSDSWSQCTRNKRPGEGERRVPGAAALTWTQTAVVLQDSRALSPTTPNWSVSSQSVEGRLKSTPPCLNPVRHLHKQNFWCTMGLGNNFYNANQPSKRRNMKTARFSLSSKSALNFTESVDWIVIAWRISRLRLRKCRWR